MKDYKTLCPTLEKYIPEETVVVDLAPKEAVVVVKPSVTKVKTEQAYELLKTDPQYLKIACAVGLNVSQVKKLHQEMLAYTNWTEPEVMPEEITQK
jgi:hypothetical protein